MLKIIRPEAEYAHLHVMLIRKIFYVAKIRRSRINSLSSPASYLCVVAMKNISQRSFFARDYLPADM